MAVQRTGASQHAEGRCGWSRWLAPVADLERSGTRLNTVRIQGPRSTNAPCCPSTTDGTDITDGTGEDARPGASILEVADEPPTIRLVGMTSSGPSPSPDAKRRGGSVPVHCHWPRSQKPEPDGPANGRHPARREAMRTSRVAGSRR